MDAQTLFGKILTDNCKKYGVTIDYDMVRLAIKRLKWLERLAKGEDVCINELYNGYIDQGFMPQITK